MQRRGLVRGGPQQHRVERQFGGAGRGRGHARRRRPFLSPGSRRGGAAAASRRRRGGTPAAARWHRGGTLVASRWHRGGTLVASRWHHNRGHVGRGRARLVRDRGRRPFAADRSSARRRAEFNGAPFYGIVGRTDDAPTEIAEGQAIVPYAATGPRQWVQGPQWWNTTWLHRKYVDGTVSEYFMEEGYATHNLTNEDTGKWQIRSFKAYSGTYYRRCTSVEGDATRGGTLGWQAGTADGLNGRASEPVLIPQPRRRAPGWDGCRDRCFGVYPNDLRQDDLSNFACPNNATLLPDSGLQYLRPNQRSDHHAIHAPQLGNRWTEATLLGEMYVFGGVGYGQEKYRTPRRSLLHGISTSRAATRLL